MSVNIISVCKTGGWCNTQYVDILYKSVCRALQNVSDVSFICLTDDMNVKVPVALDLLHGWHGWWSKIELFTIEGPSIFFDLDTVIVGDIAPLIELVKNTTEKKFWMLKPFGRHEQMASGIMAWTGDWSKLYERFNYEVHPKQFRGDQDYLTACLQDNKDVRFIQDDVSGIYSFKYHCRNKLPNDARIVCFHGNPRPHEAFNVEWVKKYWRE